MYNLNLFFSKIKSKLSLDFQETNGKVLVFMNNSEVKVHDRWIASYPYVNEEGKENIREMVARGLQFKLPNWSLPLPQYSFCPPKLLKFMNDKSFNLDLNFNEDLEEIQCWNSFPDVNVALSRCLFIGGDYLLGLISHEHFKTNTKWVKIKYYPHIDLENDILKQFDDIKGCDKIYWSLFENMMFSFDDGLWLFNKNFDPYAIANCVIHNLRFLRERLKNYGGKKPLFYLIIPTLVDLLAFNTFIKGHTLTKEEATTVQTSHKSSFQALYALQEYLHSSASLTYVLNIQYLIPNTYFHQEAIMKIVASESGAGLPKFPKQQTTNGFIPSMNSSLVLNFTKLVNKLLHSNKVPQILKPKPYTFIVMLNLNSDFQLFEPKTPLSLSYPKMSHKLLN